MIKTHTINLSITDEEIYSRIEKIAAKQDVNIETVLELLISKGLNPHLESNLEWAESLDKEAISTYRDLFSKQ